MSTAIMCVAMALGQVVCDDSPSMAALIKDLRAAYSGTRGYAADRLADLGPKAAEAVPALIVALDDDDEGVGRKAARALGGIGAPAVPALLKVIGNKHGNTDSRRWAIWAVGTIPVKDKRVDEALIAALRDKFPDVRREAADSVGYLNIYGAIPNLIRLIEYDFDDSVQLRAINTICGFGVVAKDATPALVRVIKSPDVDPFVPGEAARALVFLGRDGIAALASIIRDKSNPKNVRATAVWALGNSGRDISEVPGAVEIVLPLLPQVLAEQDVELRRQALFGLGKLGRKAKPAIPAIEKLLHRGPMTERLHAAETILQIDARNVKAIQVVIAALQERDAKGERYAADLLNLGPRGERAVPWLAENLRSPDIALVLVSARALGEIGRVAKAAAPALRSLLKSENPAIRQAAEKALERIGASRDEPPAKKAADK